MELIRQNQKQIPASYFAVHPHLPRYVGLMLGLLLGIMFVVAFAAALTGLMPPPSSLFAAYDKLIVVDTQAPTFGSNYETISQAAFELACTTASNSRYCLYQPENGPFAEIRRLAYNAEGEIGVYFAVRGNALTVGDLALLWGRPTITRHENSLVLHWNDQGMDTVVRADNGQFNYFLPVPYLMLAGSPQTNS